MEELIFRIFEKYFFPFMFDKKFEIEQIQISDFFGGRKQEVKTKCQKFYRLSELHMRTHTLAHTHS